MVMRCGACCKACPMHLVPSLLARYVETKRYELCREWGISDCMECGSCAYVCPAKIDLVQYMRLGKTRLLNAERQRTCRETAAVADVAG